MSRAEDKGKGKGKWSLISGDSRILQETLVRLTGLYSFYGIIYVTWYTRHLPKATGVRSPVFQHLQEPNRAQYMACLVGVEKRG